VPVIGRIAGTAGGWLLARWDGAILGFIIGSFADSALSGGNDEKRTDDLNYAVHARQAVYSNDFNMILLSLSAAVMQSDGTATRNELDYVKSFLIRQFGIERAKQSLLALRDILKNNIPLEQVCAPLRMRMAYGQKLELLHYLFGIANADGRLSQQENAILQQIALLTGIGTADFNSIAAMFLPADNGAAYRILGIEASVSDEEVKKAYRRKAMESHPDRVGNLGEDLRQSAEEKFKKIQAAYEEIKKRRGMA
jgi:DnaJ like chaperone protein